MRRAIIVAVTSLLLGVGGCVKDDSAIEKQLDTAADKATDAASKAVEKTTDAASSAAKDAGKVINIGRIVSPLKPSLVMSEQTQRISKDEHTSPTTAFYAAIPKAKRNGQTP